MPKLINHDTRRGQLVKAAWRTVAAGGVEALSIRQVAEAAKIVPGSLRHVFPTQNDLIGAVADELERQVRDEIAESSARHWKREWADRRLLALLPLSPAQVQRWRVEHALYVGAHRHARFAAVVAACRLARDTECAAVVRALAGQAVDVDRVDYEILRTLSVVEGLAHRCAHHPESNHAVTDAQIVLRGHIRDLQQRWEA